MNWHDENGPVSYPGMCTGIVRVPYTYCAECVENGNTD